MSYFLTRDTRLALIADTAVPKSAFERTLSQTQAKVKVMFFDACHSGASKDKDTDGTIIKNRIGQPFNANIVSAVEQSKIYLNEMIYLNIKVWLQSLENVRKCNISVCNLVKSHRID